MGPPKICLLLRDRCLDVPSLYPVDVPSLSPGASRNNAESTSRQVHDHHRDCYSGFRA